MTGHWVHLELSANPLRIAWVRADLTRSVCSCGWVGDPHTDAAEATEQGLQHSADPEADEINAEDLDAAAGMVDQLVAGTFYDEPECNEFLCTREPHLEPHHQDVTGHTWVAPTPDRPIIARAYTVQED